MNHSHRILVVLFLASAWTSSSSAQEVTPRSSHPADYDVRFDDDPLEGVGMSERGSRIRVRPQKGRVTLIRPRTHFVPELTRAVENL